MFNRFLASSVAFVLFFSLFAQNLSFALNPFAIGLSFRSEIESPNAFTVFDLKNFVVDAWYEDDSVFDLPDNAQLIVQDGDVQLFAVLTNEEGEEIDRRELYLDHPYLELTEGGKKLLVTYNALDLMENGVNTASGVYKFEIVDGNNDDEIVAQSNFFIAKPPAVDKINLDRKIAKKGMEVRFNLESTEETVPYVPLSYAYPGLDLTNRDYLPDDTDITVYDEEINLVASLKSSDISWNSDGTYSYFADDGDGEFMLMVTNRLGDSFTDDFTVEKAYVMDILVDPNPASLGDVIGFNLSYMDELSFELPIVSGSPFDVEGNIVWENFDEEFLYKFVIYEKAEEVSLVDTKYLYINNADTEIEPYDFIDTEIDTVVSNLKAGQEYIAQIQLETPDQSFVLGRSDFKLNEAKPAKEVAEAFVLPGEEKELFMVAADEAMMEAADEAADEAIVDDAEDDPVQISIRCMDVFEDYWAYSIINALLDIGNYPIQIEEGGFVCRPLQDVSRKQFTAWLLKAYRPEDFAKVADMNIDDVHVPFPDLDIDDPYTPYIARAAELDIIHGHPDGTFRPDLQINRAEVLKILLRSSELFEGLDDELLDLELNHPGSEPVERFSDVYDDQWYYSYLYFGVVNEIIEGYQDGSAKMEQGIIFGEAAKILYLAQKLQGIV